MSAEAEAPEVVSETPADDGAADLAEALEILETPDISDPMTFEDPKPDPEPTPEDPNAETKPAEVQPEGDKKPEEKPEEEKPPEGQAASGWAKVKRAEQRLLKERQAFKAESEQYQRQSAEIKQQQETLKTAAAEAQANPIAFLEKLGITYQDLTNRVLADGKPGTQEVARRGSSEVAKLAEQVTQLQQTIQQNKANEEGQQFKSDYENDIKATLAGDDFALIRSHPDAAAQAWDFAEGWYATHKEVLQPRDAVAKLQSAWSQELSGLRSHEAVLSLFREGGDAAPPQPEGDPSKVSRAGTTPQAITNNLVATPPTPPDLDSLSEEEDFQEALRLVPD